ncbi:DUF2141 domain-containing protein [Corallincola spongiicola]|uniref:DUF2141 domain-containing protein n=2 Tax=Corallincola spongiicola TaxID=2520508 RepID=A0ABY1WS16_9GAMM|nr:DUF2141 domain-containing protein [Corallincola spongiicola]
MYQKRLTFLFATTICCCQPALADGFIVSGTVMFAGAGDIYVALVDRTNFDAPNQASHQLKLTPTKAQRSHGSIRFSFENVAVGSYAIKTFLDENGNGELDMGMFGPQEPWAIFQPASSSWGAPDFEEVKFLLDSSMSNIELLLE